MQWDSDILYRVFVVLGTSVVAVAGTAALHAAYEHFTSHVKNRQKLGWAFAMFILALNVFMVALLLVKVDDLHRAQRIQARFYPASEAYTEMKRVLSEAKEGGTIYVLNSFEDPYVGLDRSNPGAEEARREYFGVIEDKLGRVNYRRVLQVRDVAHPKIAGLVDPTYAQHFRNMVALQDAPKNEIVTSLQVAPARYSMSFVIVENVNGRSFLTWQVDRHLPDQGGYKAAGYMIVEDPDQVIIRHFKGLFNEVAHESRLVRMEDIEPVPAQASAP